MRIGEEPIFRSGARYSTLKIERSIATKVRSASDMDNFVDLIRRMQTPYYEEARRHFGCEAVQQAYLGANEALPYTPKSLQHIATLCVESRTPDSLWRIGLSSVVETLRLTTSGHGPLMAV